MAVHSNKLELPLSFDGLAFNVTQHLNRYEAEDTLLVQLGSHHLALLELQFCEFGSRVYRQIIHIVSHFNLPTAPKHHKLTIRFQFAEYAR